MYFIGAFILDLFAMATLAIKPGTGLLIVLAVKPIIDATWKFSVGGFNALDIIGTGVPLIVLLRMVFLGETRHGIPLIGFWMFYLFSNLIGVALILSSGKLLGSLEILLRVLNGFVGFYMLQTYVKDREDFRKVLLAFLIAGMFPMAMGFYQALTGQSWQIRHTTGGLIRSVGVYHDVFNFRYYVFQTLTAILLLWSYFFHKGFLRKSFLFVYALLCLFILFRVYSKAGFAILAVWVLLWTILQRKIGTLVVIIVALFMINAVTGNRIFKDVQIVFSKEIAASEGTGETKYIFAGRMSVWERYWSNWGRGSLFSRLFGSGTAAGGAHNDYLRVLVSSGIIGLFAYVLLLLAIGFSVGRLILREINPLHVMALMIYLMWLIDTIGLVPSLYPSYQWYVWGMIGLAIRGVDGLSPAPAVSHLAPRKISWNNSPSD